MRKKVSYILMILLLFLLVGSVKADYTCKYYHVKLPEGEKFDIQKIDSYETDMNLGWISFNVENGTPKRSTMDTSDNIKGGEEDIVNWNESYGGFNAQNYSTYGFCPPFMYVLADQYAIGEQWEYYVFDTSATALKIYQQYITDADADWMFILKLQEGPKPSYDFDKKFTLTYNSNYPTETNLTNETKYQTVSYEQVLQGDTKIIEMPFISPIGYIFTGWKVCGTDSNNYTTCFTDLRDDEDNVKDIFNVFGYKQKIEIKAQWIVATDAISPFDINEYGLGSKQCKASGYVWNEKEYDGEVYSYCNVDNLLYVGCGGANDIPVQVPALISLFVNLLKIATPIILIFVSIITLLKAMSAQKEDEIKKATSSLIKKIIAAAMVFFVIAIVQYIVSIVASDEEDYSNFTNCLDCFLNNSCETNTYYRTVSSGSEYCIPLTEQYPIEESKYKCS